MNEEDDKYYKRDIIKTEWFYVGRPHEKKTAMFNKKENVQDHLNSRIDNKMSRRTRGFQAFHSVEILEDRLNFKELHHEHPMFSKMSKNELVLDKDLRGYFRGGQKKLIRTVEEFKKLDEYKNYIFK